MFWMVVILSFFSVADSIGIGKIENYVVIGSVNRVLLNISRGQCICEMIQSNQTISVLNYFSFNQTCQVFYTNGRSIVIGYNLNSTLMFVNQSSISITNIPMNGKYTLEITLSSSDA